MFMKLDLGDCVFISTLLLEFCSIYIYLFHTYIWNKYIHLFFFSPRGDIVHLAADLEKQLSHYLAREKSWLK